MRAAVYRRAGEVEIEAVSVPVPDAGEALIEIDYCGICGTDLHMMLDGWGTPGSVFGHEWSGRVIDAADSGLVEGTRVVGLPSAGCGDCESCRSARPSLCERRQDAGTSLERGAFSQYLLADPRRLVEVPDGIEQARAAYTEPLAVALHAVTNSKITDSQRALVFGAGPIGAAIIAILVARGISVAAVELTDVRLELAAALGATVFRPDELTIPDHPGDTPEPGYHVVFESSGARSASETGLTQLVGGGTLVIVGTGLDYPRLDTNRVILNELHITGAFNYDADGFGAALDLIASGTLPLDLLIHPETVGLEGMLDAMTQLRSGEIAGKVLVTP